MPLDRSADTRIAVLKNINPDMRQFEALDKLSVSPLLDVICDPKMNNQPLPHVDLQRNLHPHIAHLNPSQKKAVVTVANACLTQSNAIHLIHGPPGCGKSEVIIGLILQMWLAKRRGEGSMRILLCAPSNAAIDDIFVRLINFRQNKLTKCAKYNMVRIGRSENKNVSGLTLDSIVERELQKHRNIQDNEEERKMELSHLEAKKNQLEYQKKHPGLKGGDEDYLITLQEKLTATERAIEDLKSGRVKKLEGRELREKKRELEVHILENAHIIATTLSSCFNSQMAHALSLRKLNLSCCIVDEATQCIEPDTLIPLMLGVNNLVLVGDPQQLPATVLSQKAKLFGLERSLFARHQQWWLKQPRDAANNHCHFLNTQYRMHPAIAQWPSEYFYRKEVLSHESLESRSAQFPLQPYVVLSHERSQSQDECNYHEGVMVVNLVRKIRESNLFESTTTIGIITPYNRQKDLIKKKLGSKQNVEVGSVDSYQGRERDIIIFSCVRTEGVGFMSGVERLNVALTRARQSLIIVGNFKSLEKDTTWASLLNNAKERRVHRYVSSSQELLSEVIKPEWADRIR
uniref:AAA+ ATPase domain-containing protein n=2 Tax=Graphocephala atropunctata TaxID=36148 RepID=A0A1B6KSE0_9HEMI